MWWSYYRVVKGEEREYGWYRNRGAVWREDIKRWGHWWQVWWRREGGDWQEVGVQTYDGEGTGGRWRGWRWREHDHWWR